MTPTTQQLRQFLATIGGEDVLLAAAEDSMFGDDYTGFCVECGAEHYGIEPDARQYRCEECGAMAVYGAEELLIYVA